MPALANTFLFAEPDDNYLNFASVVLHQIIQENKQPGQSITEIMGADATPENVKTKLLETNAITFAGCGHGAVNIFTLQNLAPFLHAENPDELGLMKGRVVALTSCLTGEILGPALVDAGALSYVGYRREFYFYIGDAAGTTRAVQSPFLAEFEYIKALLHGKSTGEAHEAQLKKYDEEMAYWLTGEGKNHDAASELASILGMNKSINVFLGEGGIAPSPKTGVLGMQINPAITFAVASIPIAYFIYKTAIAH